MKLANESQAETSRMHHDKFPKSNAHFVGVDYRSPGERCECVAGAQFR